MANSEKKTVKIGDYTVSATVDEQGQLQLAVEHADGTEVTNTDMDVAQSKTQWAALLVSEGVEMKNISMAEPDAEERRTHGA